MPFALRTLGRTRITVGALGLSASYGAGADDVELAFDRGVNYFYWGSFRRAGFGEGLRRLAPQRDRYALVMQSYTRMASLLGTSLDRALKTLNASHADVLLLGYWNRKPPPTRILDATLDLQRRGRIRHLAISSHKRVMVPELAADPRIGVVHFRYNAAHPGAERDIFPHLPEPRAGMVAFTATSWGQLLDPKRTPAGERTPTATDCYRFVLSQPAVDLCMTGTSNLEQTKQALKALELGPMDPSELDWMKRVGRSR